MKLFPLFHSPLVAYCLTIVFFTFIQRIQYLIAPKMDLNITHEFYPIFRVYSDGHIERYFQWDYIPPSLDPKTRVVSKDVVVVSAENQVLARIYLPETAKTNTKLPLIVYIHGGGFSIQSAFSSMYHYYINTLSSRTGYMIVSIEYRLAPEHMLPACYNDSWEVIKWIGQRNDPWLNKYADFNKVYLVGDSAGANIAHNMAIRTGSKYYSTGDKFGVKIVGLVLVDPYFGIGSEPEDLWYYICQDTTGTRDSRLYPSADMDAWLNMGCKRVLVCVAETDLLREAGWNYYEELKGSDWEGEIELFESPGEDHVFHLWHPRSENAVCLMDQITGFLHNKAVAC